MNNTQTDDTGENTPGVQIDMINERKLNGATSNEKIRLILDSVQENNIVILETGLKPDEESRLVERTMGLIQPNGFSGIEIETYKSESTKGSGFLARVLNKKTNESNLTVIGPANQMKTLHKDETLLSTLVTYR